jgi:uncharacterized protein (TIGR02466 family)
MIINKLLSVPIYEFQCDESIIDKIYNLAINEEFDSNTYNTISKKNFYNEELYDWLDDCLEEVRKIYYVDSIKFKITNCWINKSNKLQYHHVHSHPNSIVSGILYLTTHNSGETVFYYDNPWKKMVSTTRTVEIQKKIFPENEFHRDPITLTSMISPRKGKLILFPSSIFHGTKANKELFPRYSLSLNSYFSGSVSWGDGNINELVVNTVGVRELQNNI